MNTTVKAVVMMLAMTATGVATTTPKEINYTGIETGIQNQRERQNQRMRFAALAVAALDAKLQYDEKARAWTYEALDRSGFYVDTTETLEASLAIIKDQVVMGLAKVQAERRVEQARAQWQESLKRLEGRDTPKERSPPTFF